MKQKKTMILDRLSYLPRKMLLLAQRENVAEFVLYELCQETCFNFRRAAFFVDNPDFDCCKGIAGFSKEESCNIPNGTTIWEDPDSFTQYMRQSLFNQTVRRLSHPSLTGKNNDEKEKTLHAFAEALHLQQPLVCTWNMKHDNHGVMLYELEEQQDDVDHEQLLNGFCLLGFCPVSY